MRRGRLSSTGCTLLLALLGIVPALAAAPVRVGMVAADPGAATTVALLRVALEAPDVIIAPALRTPDRPRSAADLESLRSTDVVLFHHGPGPLTADGAAALRTLLESGRPWVVLGASRKAWQDVPRFCEDILGAVPGEPFAAGAAMSVINLFAHPILSGVSALECDDPFPSWGALADDVELILEGTVGESTTPLGWVRPRGPVRLCHLLPASAAALRDPACQRLVANAIRWAARRPVPGAQAAVQRTFMPDAHPGAIAITFPSGPGVCFDPVRGGINYVWDGDLVDLRPRWLTKQGAPARIFGEIFYTERSWQPFRVGAPDADPVFHFRGYTLHRDGPELHYEVAGRAVHETITALPDGDGIRRRFRVAAAPGPLWLVLEPQRDAEVEATGVSRDGDRLSFVAPEGGEFSLILRRRAGGVRP